MKTRSFVLTTAVALCVAALTLHASPAVPTRWLVSDGFNSALDTRGTRTMELVKAAWYNA